MKKLLSFVLIASLCLLMLASCGGENADNSSAAEPASQAVSEPPAESAAVSEPESGNPALENAKAFLYSKYKNNSVTSSDYSIVDTVTIDNVSYKVVWTVEVTSGDPNGVKVTPNDNGTVTIDVNERASSEIIYNLIGTISDNDGNSIVLTMERSIPEFKMLSWDEFTATEDGSAVAVKGVVSAIIAKSKGNTANCLYIQGDNCGYYVYGLATDPVTDDSLEVGMTVAVTGEKSTYNGTLEITNGSVEILDANKKQLEPVDYTELYANASALTDTSLAGRQAMLVTVKGVEITGEDAGSGYYKFKLGALESYVRISSSVCPLPKDEQEAFKKAHAEHFGWTGDATGVICVFNGAFYLTPVDSDGFVYTSLPAKSDSEMVEFEAGNLKLDAEYFASTEIAVPLKGASYEQVTIEWSTDCGAVRYEDGKLIVTVGETDERATVTAVVKCGDAEKTVRFDVEITARALTGAEILERAFALPVGESLKGTQTLTGVITAIPTAYSEQYSNITVNIQVADKEVQCFRLKGDGAASLAVGDKITVTGTLKNYNGTIEFDAACTFVLVSSGDEQPGEVDASVQAILDAAFALQDGEIFENDVTLTGEVTTLVTAYSDQYENVSVNIKVGDKTVQGFRIKGEDAATVGVGDVITITGKIKNYKGTIEFDAGSTFVTVSKGEGEKVLSTEEEILAAAFALEPGTAMSNTYTLTGKVTEIVTEYSEQYGNITVNMQIGDKTVQCYRLKVASADDVKVGDTIKVTGKLKNYNGTVEFDAGCTFEK